MSDVCIGLFGTCGGSTWRDAFEQTYQQHGMIAGTNYYNPQVENWTPTCAVEEARHLAEDRIIVFPITRETYAEGSLSEVGFSILNAIKLDDRRHFVVLVEQELSESLMQDAVRAKASLRARALVVEHLKRLRIDGLYLVETLQEALEISLACFRAETELAPYRHFTPHRRA